MVQTIVVTEATLMDSVTRFVREDPNGITTGANWWRTRVRAVEKWLTDESIRAAIPEDGTTEMIRYLVQRGDIYTTIQLKCWKHILLELQDVPCVLATLRDVDGQRTTGGTAIAPTSPSRGKLRPGKELIILSDDANQQVGIEAESESQSTPSPPHHHARDTGHGEAPESSTSGKTFSTMSMMERQAEWLRKKQERMAAEKQRQEEETQKELTFQPKLMRRATFTGDRPGKDKEDLPQQQSTQRVVVSFRKEDKPVSGSRPPSGNGASRANAKAAPRSASSKKKKASVSTTQPLEVSSSLLDSMKSELTTSLAKSGSTASTTTSTAATSGRGNETDNHNDNDTLPPEVEDASVDSNSITSKQQAETETKTETSSPPPPSTWSAQPMIGGFRIEFDSSDTKARLVLQDASRFELNSMYRKTDRQARRDGIALHMGRREDTYDEQVIAVLFDKEKLSEHDATQWWSDHEHRFTQYMHSEQSASNALLSAVAGLTDSVAAHQ